MGLTSVSIHEELAAERMLGCERIARAPVAVPEYVRNLLQLLTLIWKVRGPPDKIHYVHACVSTFRIIPRRRGAYLLVGDCGSLVALHGGEVGAQSA
jgi:hypothetical protein